MKFLMVVYMSMKNLWRKKWRTILLGLSLFFVGLMSVVFLGYSMGIKKQMIDFAIDNFVGRGIFFDNATIQDILWPEKVAAFDGSLLEKALINEKLSFRLQYRSHGLLRYGEGQIATLAIGVEAKITNGLKIVQGSFEWGNNLIFVSEKIAEDLEIKVGDTLVLQVVTEDGVPNFDYFTVGGIVRLMGISGLLSGHFSFISLDSMRKLKNVSDTFVTEVVITENKKEEILAEIGKKLSKEYNVAYKDWRSYGSIITAISTTAVVSSFVILCITMVVVLIFLFNTMLSTVEERKREIGIMMSMGASGIHIALFFVVEIVMLSLFFVLPAVLIGTVINWFFSVKGILVPEAIAVMLGGFDRLYPAVDGWISFITYIVFLYIMVLTSLYAIVKAFKLNPVEVLRNE